MSFLSDCLTKDTSKPIKMKLLRGMHYWLTLTGWPKVYMARLRSSLVRQDVRVTLTVLFYMFSSISLVMLNKLVLNVTETPILFLWMQLVVAVALLHLAAYFGVFQLPTIEWQKCKNVMPLILINAIGLSANTYCLQEVDASLFQVGSTRSIAEA